MQPLSPHTFRQRSSQAKKLTSMGLLFNLPLGRILAAACMVFVGYGLGRGALSLAHEAAEIWRGPPISKEAAAFLNSKEVPKAAPATQPKAKVKEVLTPAAVVQVPVVAPPVKKKGAKPLLAASDFHHSMQGQDAVLTKKMRWLLDDYKVPEGGIVVLDIHTGDILTAVGRKNGKADVRAALTAQWPAASVFKMVTTSALLKHQVNPAQKLCFNGGLRKVTRRQLDQTRGAKCSSMVHAFAKSQNIPFARWTDRHLNVASLTEEATHWGFGHDNRLQLPLISVAEPVIPKERLAFAQTGAGFGEVPMSPLHGAVMAAAVANRGDAPLPKLSAMNPPVLRPMLSKGQAKTMKKAMVRAVKRGSARRAFLERRRPAMGRLGAGGKTGSLFIRSKAGQDLTWFVGFAPAEQPEVAVAAYVINGPKWRIRAPYMGREALRAALLKTSPYRPTKDPLLVQGKKKKKKVSKKSASRK